MVPDTASARNEDPSPQRRNGDGVAASEDLVTIQCVAVVARRNLQGRRSVRGVHGDNGTSAAKREKSDRLTNSNKLILIK